MIKPTYGPVNGKLFVDGISSDDIRQGQIGDCYFVSALSAIAKANPQIIRDSIQTNPDNTYTVRFFDHGRPTYVTIDNKFYHTPSGQLVYGSSTDKGEMWVPVMEKAYAKWKNGYRQIGQGGNPATALYELTGIKSHLLIDSSMSPGPLYTYLQKSLANNEAVVAGTPSGPQALYNREGLVPTHAYTVIGVQDQNGQKFVTLRNPWGSTEWNGAGADRKNDGTFKMPIGDFQKMFSIVASSVSPLATTPSGVAAILSTLALPF